MVICFKCDTATRADLDDLVKSGRYADYGQAIALAIRNLVVMEADLATTNSLVVEGDPVREREARPGSKGNDTLRGHAVAKATPRVQRQVPTLFSLPDGTRSCVAPTQSGRFDDGDPVPLERWIFGQYNRLLPVKATCRAFANLLLERAEGVALEEAAGLIVDSATQLGEILKEHDGRFDTHRDDALSTAFPTSGSRAEKSRLRFRNQFVAATTGGGQLVGLPVELKLVSHVDASRKRIALTSAGWEFALLRNPVLDGEQETPDQKFFQDEQDVLLTHISRNVRVEDFAYRTILRFVTRGVSSPSDLDKALRGTLSPESAAQIRDSFVSTQRSGAISRMTDAGLIHRVRDGVKMAYVVTERATAYLETTSIKESND